MHVVRVIHVYEKLITVSELTKSQLNWFLDNSGYNLLWHTYCKKPFFFCLFFYFLIQVWPEASCKLMNCRFNMNLLDRNAFKTHYFAHHLTQIHSRVTNKRTANIKSHKPKFLRRPGAGGRCSGINEIYHGWCICHKKNMMWFTLLYVQLGGCGEHFPIMIAFISLCGVP